jgi:ribosome-associated protein
MPAAGLGVPAAAPAPGVEHGDSPGPGATAAGPTEGDEIIGTDPAVRPSGQDLLRLIQGSLADSKAIDPVIIDLAGKTDIADVMVVVTGSSQRHLASMAEHLLQRLKNVGLKGLSAEGTGHSDWVLIDAGDVVVHLFKDEVRHFYDLEKLWGVVLPEVPAEVQLRA